MVLSPRAMLGSHHFWNINKRLQVPSPKQTQSGNKVIQSFFNELSCNDIIKTNEWLE